MKTVTLALALSLLAAAGASLASTPEEDSSARVKADALGKIIDTQLEIYKAKHEKVTRFREQIFTNFLVLILAAIGGLVVLRQRLQLSREISSASRLRRKLGILAFVLGSFSSFAVFLESVDSSNRLDRNLAEARLSGLTRTLAETVGYAESVASDTEFEGRLRALAADEPQPLPSAEDLGGNVQTLVPFVSPEKSVTLNAVALVLFFLFLIPAAYLAFSILEPVPKADS